MNISNFLVFLKPFYKKLAFFLKKDKMNSMKKSYLILLGIILAGCSSPYCVDDLPYLKGKTASQVRFSFGKPQVVRKEANATLWSYYKDECSSLIFFDADDIVQYAELRGKCSSDFPTN